MSNRKRSAGSRRGVADMSLPPEQRRRRRAKGAPVGPQPIAQMDHGSNPRGRKMAAEGEKLMERDRPVSGTGDRFWARFGDAYHELPRRCWIAEPVLVPEPRYGARPMSFYDGLATDLLGRGVPVPDHPSACAVPQCGHAQVWHRHRTRTRPCQVAGCACTALVRQDVDRRDSAA